MTPDRWERSKSIYWNAMEIDPSGRGPYLESACEGDPELRREVDSLIEAHHKAGDFIVSTAMKEAVKIMSSDGPQSLIGRELGNYHLVSLLGSGGMGDVYLAFDMRLGRRVAVKILTSHPFDDSDRVRRFQREARTASALNHPNIITIYDFGRENGRDYIVSEFVEGSTLRETIAKRDLSLNEILDLVIQVAGAPEGLQAIIDSSLAKDRESRYLNAREMLSDLETVLEELPEQTRIQKAEGKGTQEAAQTGAQKNDVTTRKGVNNPEEAATGRAAGPTRRWFIAAIAVLAAIGVYFLNTVTFGICRSATGTSSRPTNSAIASASVNGSRSRPPSSDISPENSTSDSRPACCSLRPIPRTRTVSICTGTH